MSASVSTRACMRLRVHASPSHGADLDKTRNVVNRGRDGARFWEHPIHGIKQTRKGCRHKPALKRRKPVTTRPCMHACMHACVSARVRVHLL